MKIEVPTHFTDAQARTVLVLYELLLDSLIDFYTAFCAAYPLATIEPDTDLGDDLTPL